MSDKESTPAVAPLGASGAPIPAETVSGKRSTLLLPPSVTQNLNRIKIDKILK